MPVYIRSVTRNALKHQIVNQLTEQIVSGVLKPEERLPAEPLLAEHFGVSRTAIREALSVLADRGFIAVRHGSGTFINPPAFWNNLDPTVLLVKGKTSTLGEMLEAREILEPIVARLAAERASPEDIASLELSLSVPAATDEEKVDADFLFHLGLAEASHNHVLVIMLNSVREIMRAVHRDVFARPMTYEQAQGRHRAILDEIKRRNSEGAYQVMQQHMLEASQNLMAVMMPLEDKG
jgi:GntR family transcriptional repressor for pyruvate dehydrogenase complex